MKRLFIVLSLLLCLGLVGCGEKEEVIRVGASPAPHAEILRECKEYVESKGYQLEIIEYTDYVQPNFAVNNGSIDANFFQHLPYLNDFNAENGTSLASVGAIHFEPLGLYSGRRNDITNLNNATIGIPNDTTNGARALYLLEDLGIITLNSTDKTNMLITKNDISSNPYNVKIEEMEAAQLPIQLPSFDFAVINGNYALSAKVTDKLLATESTESFFAVTYANILCVKVGNENNEKTKVLLEALTQDNIREYIQNQYKGTVIPVF